MADPTLRYPIGAVSKLTGIPVETLRVWERRYGVVTPVRDERGRLYSDGDVRRLQLLAGAVARGHSIGRLAKLSDAELQGLLAAVPLPAWNGQEQALASSPEVIAGVMAALQADATGIDRELGRLSLAMPPRDLVHRVVLPVMRRVGEEWEAGRLTVGQEHLASAALRNLLGGMVRLSGADRAETRILFATPSGDRHEFGILAAAMLTALRGCGVVYLGPDLPGAQIVDMAARSGARVVVLGMIYGSSQPSTMDEVRYVSEHLPSHVELWVGGRTAAGTALPPRAVAMADFTALEMHLGRVGGRR